MNNIVSFDALKEVRDQILSQKVVNLTISEADLQFLSYSLSNYSKLLKEGHIIGLWTDSVESEIERCDSIAEQLNN